VNALESCGLLAGTIRDLTAERARALKLEAERDTYREITILALEQVAALTGQLDKQFEITAALRDELRRYTERAVRDGGVLAPVLRPEAQAAVIAPHDGDAA
jgi:hypothetical protein